MGAVEFGQFFRRIRRSVDVKQEAVAARLGVTQPAVSDIERGDRKEFSPGDVERVLRAIAEASQMDEARYERILAEGMAAAGFVHIPSKGKGESADIELERDPDPEHVAQFLASYSGSDPAIAGAAQTYRAVRRAMAEAEEMLPSGEEL